MKRAILVIFGRWPPTMIMPLIGVVGLAVWFAAGVLAAKFFTENGE